MSAFPNSGRLDHSKLQKLRGCFRPEGNVRGANSDSPVPIYCFDGLIKPSTQVVPYQVAERKRPLEAYLAAGVESQSEESGFYLHGAVVLVTVIMTFAVPSPVQEMASISAPTLGTPNVQWFMFKIAGLPISGSHPGGKSPVY